MQVNSRMPILFLSFNLRLSTQKGSRIVQIQGALTVSLRKSRAIAARYLYSRCPRQSSHIYLVRFICSILNTRHKNLVGFFAPPYSPPMHLIFMALSIKLSALRAKHSSFQYRQLKILLRVVLSNNCVKFFYDIPTEPLQGLLQIQEISVEIYILIKMRGYDRDRDRERDRDRDRDRERDRDRDRSRHTRDYESRGYRRHSNSPPSDSERRRSHSHHYYEREYDYSRSRDGREGRQGKDRSDDRYYPRPSRSNSSDKRNDEQWKQQQQDQKIRLAIRNNTINYDLHIHQAYMKLPESKREELAEQAQSPEKIQQCILVRELYVSGMQDANQAFIRDFFSKYGEIEAVEIIKNFIFVKYFKVEDASNACADYHNINMTLHNNNHNTNFKIFFADHLKRFNVVSNNPNYEINETLIPVVYASVRNDPQYANEQYLRNIFEKFGFIRNLEIKRNELPTQRTYVLVEYQTLEQAMRAREKVKGMRDRLGDRKSEITLLIDNDKITRKYPNITNQIRYQRKRQNNVQQQVASQQQQQQPQDRPLESSYPNTFSAPPLPYGQERQEIDLDGIMGILNQHAGMDEEEHQQADWCGFLTLNKKKKIEVDFVRIHKEECQLDDGILNIAYRADLREALDSGSYNLAGKFRAAQPGMGKVFKQQYINYFKRKGRAGILMTPRYLIYLIPPIMELNINYPIADDELLALFFKLP